LHYFRLNYWCDRLKIVLKLRNEVLPEDLQLFLPLPVFDVHLHLGVYFGQRCFVGLHIIIIFYDIHDRRSCLFLLVSRVNLDIDETFFVPDSQLCRVISARVLLGDLSDEFEENYPSIDFNALLSNHHSLNQFLGFHDVFFDCDRSLTHCFHLGERLGLGISSSSVDFTFLRRVPRTESEVRIRIVEIRVHERTKERPLEFLSSLFPVGVEVELNMLWKLCDSLGEVSGEH
jgi:hypothetical protein